VTNQAQPVRLGNKSFENVVRTDERYGHDGFWLGPRGRDYGAWLEHPKPYQIANRGIECTDPDHDQGRKEQEKQNTKGYDPLSIRQKDPRQPSRIDEFESQTRNLSLEDTPEVKLGVLRLVDREL